MRAGLSTIQQTLTPEAASVLNQSIAEASRRNHGQTTPLHVAATLLASPSGYLHQACIRSHPNSSHPLQCRALELCFSVALERLPTAQNLSSNAEPPISNALMATLKRAQAHQRRGCPEQQQQPLLAVKVELEQLIISILDDPSVSRVMREASFSSPAVKAAIEQSLNNSQSNAASVTATPKIGLAFRPAAQPTPLIPSVSGRNLYLNPRLQQQGSTVQSGNHRGEEVKRVIDILSKTRKRNPVLVGESEPEAVLREVLRRIEKKEVGDVGLFKNVEVISMEKELASAPPQLPAKIKELCCLIEGRMMSSNGGGGIILDLGDLKWLVDQPANLSVSVSGGAPHQGVSDAAKAAVVEIGKILMKFGEDTGSHSSNGRLWLIGTATCETYLRCQVYHPKMENDWDLQAVSIAARVPLPGMFPRPGTNGILSSTVESLCQMKSFQTPTPTVTKSASENMDPLKRLSCCPQCLQNYEHELTQFVAARPDQSPSEFKSEATRQLLPQWLHNAKTNSSGNVKGTIDLSQSKDESLILKQKSQELQRIWADACVHLHPSFHQKPNFERIIPKPLSMTGLYNPNLLDRQPFLPKLQQNRSLGNDLQLNINSERPTSPLGSPVATDLALGRTKIVESTVDESHKEHTKDFLGCISSESQNKLCEFQSDNKPIASADIDLFKKLLKGLAERVWWQKEAASAVATTVTHCKSGSGKRRNAGAKGDIWLMFSGPDRVGKKKMAEALSELVCGVAPVMVCLGSRRDGEESDSNIRGKTALDRVAEAVRRNPFSVIVLQDIDEADTLVRGIIKRAMERGRLTDSHSREISLGNVIFILTLKWLPDNLKNSSNGLQLTDEKLVTLASGGWQLRLSVGEKTGKRQADWLHNEDRATRQRKETGPTPPFDLNQVAATEDDRLDGSRNSSDLTVDHEVENCHVNRQSHELLDSVDNAIIFKPVDFAPILCDIERTITAKFSSIVGKKLDLKIQQEALEKILGGLWLGQTSTEAWVEKVLAASIQRVKTRLTVEETLAARLELDTIFENRSYGDWLPSRITVVVDGQ
ncbi:hypothetical protein Nepgr_018465 [Nepenthes gracilis]|uniref:Clp R domain-containing protein n=1 Tax=Nepenthes gracilis TaxID=150966 RepID=A0AAD3STL8_NEPGR|nr:hypothetical protein Nepgr_018465 [Nepenthes gracilis]